MIDDLNPAKHLQQFQLLYVGHHQYATYSVEELMYIYNGLGDCYCVDCSDTFL